MLQPMKKKIQFGIIGCSSIAERVTIPAILKAKNANLNMIGSRSTAKAKRFAKKFSCEKYGKYNDVLNNNDIDAVYISLPIALQEREVIRCAKKGKHIICEKSASTSFSSIKKMLQVCKENKVRLMEGFSFRYHPQHKQVVKITKTKSFGKPSVFSSKFFIPTKKSNKDFRFNKHLGGSVLNDLGCYIISASCLIFETNPIFVNCKLYSTKNSDVDMYGNIYLEFPKKCVAFGVFGYENNFQAKYEIRSATSQIKVETAYNIRNGKNAQITIHNKNKMKKLRLEPSNQSQLMIEDFCNVLMNKKKSVHYERNMLIQAQIMAAARLSNMKNKLIKINEIS